MAGEVEELVSDALSALVSVTEVRGNLRKDLKNNILDAVSKLRSAFTTLQTRVTDNNVEISELKLQIDKYRTEIQCGKDVTRNSVMGGNIKPVSSQRRLFSDVVGTGTTPCIEKRYKLMVTSKLKESAEAVKTVLKSKVNPTALNVGIKTFKSLKDGRVLIETVSKNEIEILNSTINSKCGQTMESKVSPLRNPNLVLYNIPDDINKENAEEIIIKQNPEFSLKEGDIKPKFIFTSKRNHKNLVVEVSSEIRKTLLNKKIKMGWLICNLEDYVSPLRCFKCSRYNHRHVDCTAEESCPLCAGKHKLKECKTSEDNYKCVNCINFNKYNRGDKINENHSSLNKNCPSYLAILKKYKQNIDY